MQSVYRFLIWLLGLASLISCTVTNNLYVNDPVPAGKGMYRAYIGGGTGLEPEIDSVTDEGDIFFSEKVQMAPIVAAGGDLGINDRLTLRCAVHLPYAFGGFGLRLGVQHSLYDTWYKFNGAVGADFSLVIAEDSISDSSTKGSISGDFYMPFSYRFSENFEVYLTPRISLNNFYIKKNEKSMSSQGFPVNYPALSLAFRAKRVYMETTGIFFDNRIYPNFGIAFLFPLKIINQPKENISE